MKAYRGIALAIAAGVLLQAAFIAYGWFTVLGEVDEGKAFSDIEEGLNAGHDMHGLFGAMIIPLLGIALLITSFFVKVPGATKRAGMVFGAVFLQVALAFIAFGASAIGALHGLNAFVLLGAALYAARLATTPAPLGAPSRESSAV